MVRFCSSVQPVGLELLLELLGPAPYLLYIPGKIVRTDKIVLSVRMYNLLFATKISSSNFQILFLCSYYITIDNICQLDFKIKLKFICKNRDKKSYSPRGKLLNETPRKIAITYI